MDGGDCDEPNECGCSFYRAGPIGGTSNGAAFDYLQLSELCCHYFIRALVIGGTDEPTPRINTLVIYVEKDSFTEVEVVGFDGSNSVSVNNYF